MKKQRGLFIVTFIFLLFVNHVYGIDYTISGTVTRNLVGNPAIQNVTMTASNGGGTTQTNTDGFYSFSLPSGWSGTITPSKTDYEFNPESRSYSGLAGDSTAQNFIGTHIFKISGYVRTLQGPCLNLNGFTEPIAGVRVFQQDPYLPPNIGYDDTTYTDADGYYSFYVYEGPWGGATVDPIWLDLSGYIYTPPIISLYEIYENVDNANFSVYLRVGGSVEDSSENPIDGVTVTAISDDNVTATGIIGEGDWIWGEYQFYFNYHFSGTITPSKSGWGFTPEKYTYTDLIDIVYSVFIGEKLPDLQCNPTNMAISPTSIIPGDTFEFSGVIENKGMKSTGSDFQVNVYICPDQNELNFQTSYFVGYFSMAALDSGSSSSFNGTFTVPQSVLPGTYYTWVSIDPNDLIGESDETNNQQACLTPLTVVPEIPTVTAMGIPQSLLPTIDGVLDDTVWTHLDEDSLLHGGIPVDWYATWSSYADNLVTYKVCWNEETNKLYLGVNVQDDIQGTADNGAGSTLYAPHLDDAVEFFTDGDHSGGGYVYQQAQQWFVTLENHLSLQNYPTDGNHLYTRNDVQTAVQLGADGNWTCEAEITIYDTFPDYAKTLEEGDIIGWDIWYNDSDDQVYVDNYYTRDHHTGWFYGGPSYLNADYFGKLLLGAEIEYTGIKPEAPSQIITQFNLTQNYPNPLNPDTRIEYSLPKRSHVILGIYNLMGQEVIRLIDEVKETGVYSVDWDGRDRQGNVLPSGVYVYQIRAGEFTESKKLILSR